MKTLLVGRATPRIQSEKGIPATIYIHALAKELVKLGHKADVICSPMPDTEKQKYGIIEIGSLFLLRHLPKNVYEMWYSFKVGRAMKKLHKNYDVVHFLEAPAPAFFSLWFNKNRTTPFIFSTGRPITADLLWHGQGTPILTQFLSNTMHAYVFRNIDKVLTASKALRTSIVIYCKTRLDRIDVVPFISAMPDRFYPQPKDKALMKSLGIEETDKVILCLGEVAPYKNQLALMQTVGILIPDYPNLKLLLVGGINKEYFKTLNTYAERHSLDSHIIFTGYIKDHAELSKYHNLADIFALVSEAEGNLPQTVLDAMCCRKPALVSDLHQNREWARGTILYANPYDPNDVALKLKWLLGNSSMRERLGTNGHKLALERCSPRVIAEGIIKAYGHTPSPPP